jgi:hypothetical protein
MKTIIMRMIIMKIIIITPLKQGITKITMKMNERLSINNRLRNI